MSGLLKFITCGSVDDGKSTLIGHLLYDSKLIYADQEQALALDSKVGSRGGAIDYSLLLDGLMAEREQGITIDVAYRYFTTDNRSFIVADTPGHEEYTRNMAVGASFADLAVILIDAKQGVLIQTKRHARICSLMGIRYFVFAVNKMDLVNYSEERFKEIEAQIAELQETLGLKNVVIVPVSATEGDNIVNASENTAWYEGPTLLHYLETVDVAEATADEAGFYLPVQRVCRPNHEFRGFQGQIEHGTVKVGDELTTLPSREKAHVKSIIVADHEEQEAGLGQQVTIQLDREVDVSRGCVLEKESGVQISDSFTAEILWMDDAPLEVGKNFLVKLGTKEIPGILTSINYAVDINSGESLTTDTLHKNEIAFVELAVTEPIILDTFANHRTLGELILVDRISHMTSACGIVTEVHTEETKKKHSLVTKQVRTQLKWQNAKVVAFAPGADGSTEDVVEEAEARLVGSGRHTYLYAPKAGEDYAAVVRHLNRAGIIVLLVLNEGVAEDATLANESYYVTWSALNAKATQYGGSAQAATAETISNAIWENTMPNVSIESNNWVI